MHGKVFIYLLRNGRSPGCHAQLLFFSRVSLSQINITFLARHTATKTLYWPVCMCVLPSVRNEGVWGSHILSLH